MRHTLRVSTILLLTALGAAAGCTGSIGDGDADGRRPGDDVPVDADSLAPSGHRRLTRLEYERTLRDLVGGPVVDAATIELAALPSDEVKNGFSTMNGDVGAAYVEGTFGVAVAVGGRIAADNALRSSLSPCLADAAPTTDCIGDLARTFGRRAFRRPLTDAEVDAVIGTYSAGLALTPEDGIELAIVHILAAPPFLYRLEVDGAETAEPEIFALTSFELATRLSYTIWGSCPDDALLDAAESGTLDTPEGLEAQLARMASDPRTRSHAGLFFREWLRLDKVATPQQSDEFLAGVDPSGLAGLAAEETERFAVHEAFDASGSVSDLFSSQTAFVSSPALAALYGVAPGDGVELPPERAGLLGRVSMLLETAETTHPIRRGALVRRRLLCDAIEIPDPSQVPPDQIQPPPFDANKTARVRWTEQTSQGTCGSCHARINAIGFALEGFDTLGRTRTLEPILDSTGEIVNELPIDTHVEVDLGDGAPVSVSGPAALATALSESDTAALCLARQWLRYSEGRIDVVEDEATLEALIESGAQTGGLFALLTALPKQPGFRFHRRAQ